MCSGSAGRRCTSSSPRGRYQVCTSGVAVGSRCVPWLTGSRNRQRGVCQLRLRRLLRKQCHEVLDLLRQPRARSGRHDHDPPAPLVQSNRRPQTGRSSSRGCHIRWQRPNTKPGSLTSTRIRTRRRGSSRRWSDTTACDGRRGASRASSQDVMAVFIRRPYDLANGQTN